jgi:tRNA(fMet)-specific endonuclease VapC
MKHAAVHASAHGKPGLCPLGIMEITQGFEDELRDANLRTFLEEVLPMFVIVGFGLQEACLSGEIYAKLEGKRQRIGVADTSIAATAILQGLTVVTSNRKHFQRVIDLGYALTLENWREA